MVFGWSDLSAKAKPGYKKSRRLAKITKRLRPIIPTRKKSPTIVARPAVFIPANVVHSAMPLIHRMIMRIPFGFGYQKAFSGMACAQQAEFTELHESETRHWTDRGNPCGAADSSARNTQFGPEP